MTDRCRWDREAEAYMRDGEPCLRDDYGDPTHHCTGRRSCGQHVGDGELTCARCMARTRQDIRAIVLRSVELPSEAVFTGIDSEAANLAGPAANVEAWTWRKVAARQGRAWHVSLIEDDDDLHPYTVLTRWVMMLAEDYGIEAPTMPANQIGIERAAAFLERMLPRVAQDEDQDFRLFRDEIGTCRSHLEGVLRDSRAPERGAPCPDCRDDGRVVRMTREFGHWCFAEDCERIHYADDSGDRWVCPANREHWRSHEDYVRWVEERSKNSA